MAQVHKVSARLLNSRSPTDTSFSQESSNSSSIDTLLRGLTERPNVQSTLILSRKDGSIIRVTGFPLSDGNNGTGTAGSYEWSQHQSNATDSLPERGSGIGQTPEAAEIKVAPRPAEVLASSIFQFVNNANGVASDIECAVLSAGSAGVVPTGANDATMANGKIEAQGDEEGDPQPDMQDIQLLRLRTKNREIIIFPDPNYICCVVQKVGKPGSAVERR